MKLQPRILLIPMALLAVLVFFVELERRPGLFANSNYLGGFLALEVMIACL